jgi:hypothetical protein
MLFMAECCSARASGFRCVGGSCCLGVDLKCAVLADPRGVGVNCDALAPAPAPVPALRRVTPTAATATLEGGNVSWQPNRNGRSSLRVIVIPTLSLSGTVHSMRGRIVE